MNNNEELVTDVTENVEGLTTEEVVDSVQTEEKKYTEADFNKKLDEVLARKIARSEKKMRREYEDRYGSYINLANVVGAGTGIGSDDVVDLTEKMASYYRQNDIEIPSFERNYSEDDLRILANADVEDIISGGYEDIEDELRRLVNKGADNMTPKEKIIFTKLDEESKRIKDEKELASIGVTTEALKDNDFIEFAKDLNPSMSLKEKYEKFTKYRPKPMVEPIGSMKGTTQKDTAVKDFYTRDEAMLFTKEDFDKNPELYKAVEKSMYKW